MQTLKLIYYFIVYSRWKDQLYSYIPMITAAWVCPILTTVPARISSNIAWRAMFNILSKPSS